MPCSQPAPGEEEPGTLAPRPLGHPNFALPPLRSRDHLRGIGEGLSSTFPSSRGLDSSCVLSLHGWSCALHGAGL